MNIKGKLSQYITNPLDWSASAKASLLLWAYLIDQMFYLLFIEAGRSLDALRPWMNQEQLAVHEMYFVLLTILTMVMLLAIKLAPSRHRDNAVYEYVSCIYFGLTHVYYGYCIGLTSIPVGVVLVGAPVVGFILVNRKAVASAFVSSLLMIVVLSIASIEGVVPYAPLANNIMAENGQMVTVWVVSYWLLALPHILFIFSLAYYVLQRWRMREYEVTVLSQTDPLTGLTNRRYIMDLLVREKADCEVARQPLSIVMVDLDHFKRINDQWGHDVGDRALVQAAEALRSAVRQDDHVGRYGGEEFLLVLPGLDGEQAQLLAERVRTAISSVELELIGGQRLRLSASLGMSCISVADPVTVDQLVKRADEALYTAKDSGRDRLVIAA